jgi:hypothetical protein
MNQDWEEKEIRQLFRDERETDETVAPHFAATLEAAISRRRPARPGSLIRRAAIAVVALVAVGGFVLLLLGRSGTGPQSVVSITQEESAPKTSDPNRSVDVAAVTVPPEPSKPARGPRRHRQSSVKAATLISEWRSPTDFLLKTPGDQLLKTVPRVGASAIEIKVNFSDLKN